MDYQKERHNPYFNRWFSAIRKGSDFDGKCGGHNPYFNRWFSAINKLNKIFYDKYSVTILILIDGFLQSAYLYKCDWASIVTILILIDGFLQCSHCCYAQDAEMSQSLF